MATILTDKWKESIYQNIKCPITLAIMCDPVTASDGITYERQAIEEYLQKKDVTSPITREKLDSKINPAIGIKSIIDDFVKQYPEAKNEMYVPIKKKHTDHNKAVREIFEKKNYSKLLQYHDFYLESCILYQNYFLKFLELGSVDHLKYFINNTFNLEIELDGKNKLIHLVANAGRSEIVCYLIEKEVKVNNSNNSKQRPLHLVLAHCNIDAIRLIMNKSNNANTMTTNGNYPIHCLMTNTKLNEVEMVEIMEMFDNINKYNKQRKVLPIHLACQFQKKATILYLIEHGAILDKKDNNGDYPIHCLINNDNLSDDDLVEILPKIPNLEAEDKLKCRIIHHACLERSSKLIDYLLDRKVALDTVNTNRDYPIHNLFENEKITEDDILKLLSKFGDLEYKNASERTILYLACLKKKEKLIEYLLNQNVNMSNYDKHGYQPFHLYLKKTKKINIDTIKMFVKKGVNINSPTIINGIKPIHYVTKPRTITILKYLLDNGAVVEDYIKKNNQDDEDDEDEDDDDDDGDEEEEDDDDDDE